jgi:signal transduction histidine kinase
MNRLSPIVLISFCLVCVTVGAMLTGDAIVGLAPDQAKQVFEARKALCENLAVQYSLLAASGQVTIIQTAMQALVERNSDLLSAALQAADGKQLVVAGPHAQHWVQPPGQQSTLSHIQVPIYKGIIRWGTLQLSFRTQHSSWEETFVLGAWPRFVALVAVLGFFGYFIFMRRTLRHMDPSQVIPPRVKSALDSLTDGVVMLDTSGAVVLANETFCRLTERPLPSLLGKSLSRVEWVQAQGTPLVAVYKHPWERAIDQKLPQHGCRLGYWTEEKILRTFSVTSTPILDNRDVLRGVLASFHDVTEVDRANAQLRDAIVQLEQSRTQVLSQNQMLEQTNETLQVEIEQRKRVQEEREELNRKLVETSRRVGMADVASTVLHNVGNVLTSVNVSVDVVISTLKQAPIGDVGSVATMLQSHSHDLAVFLSEDLQGKQIPSYLAMLAEAVSQNSALVEQELGDLSRNVEHIRQVVSRQVDLARPGGLILEPVHFRDLMEQALAINRPALDSCACEIVLEYENLPDGMTDRHQVIQILVNLISNAKNAMSIADGRPRRLTLFLGPAADRPGFIRFQVVDTGVGISREHLSLIFTQGFTTRPEGHGIGLHSAALAAKSMGGTLQALSDGEDRGATFIFDLPLESVEVPA